MVEIRKASAEDAADVWRLICLLEDRTFDRAAFERIFRGQLASPAWCCLIALDETGAAVGMINIRIDEQLHHAARVAQILELVVDPGARSGGIGHELFQAGVSAARDAGCVQIELETSTWREGAHRFYKREGMVFDHRYYTMSLV